MCLVSRPWRIAVCECGVHVDGIAFCAHVFFMVNEASRTRLSSLDKERRFRQVRDRYWRKVSDGIQEAGIMPDNGPRRSSPRSGKAGSE